MAERFKALVSKTSGVFMALVGSNPTPSAISSPRVLLSRDSKLRRKPSIVRAITDTALARADGVPYRFYSLSSQIESERKDYYHQLEKQQRDTPEITSWLEWFLGCLGRAITSAENTLSAVLFKSQLWEKINRQSVNERQRLIINRMLEDDFKGHMNTSKYAKLAKCSTDTALRDIQDLKSRGVFIQNPGGGRSTSYRLPDSISE